MKRFFVIILVCLLLMNCKGTAFKKQIGCNFYLVAPDTEEQIFLSYHDQNDGNNYPALIEPTIFEIGYNEKYIVAKQDVGISKSKINYYIQPVNCDGVFDWKSKNGQIGPLTVEQYYKKCELLSIEIDFKDVLSL